MMPLPPPGPFVWKTDESSAKRFADELALHQTVLDNGEILAGRFMAVRIADGGSDGVAYESRPAAIEHNRNNTSRCFYFQIPMERLNAQTCDRLLWYARQAYANGVREDPAHQLIIPTRVEDFSRDVRGMNR